MKSWLNDPVIKLGVNELLAVYGNPALKRILALNEKLAFLVGELNDEKNSPFSHQIINQMIKSLIHPGDFVVCVGRQPLAIEEGAIFRMYSPSGLYRILVLPRNRFLSFLFASHPIENLSFCKERTRPITHIRLAGGTFNSFLVYASPYRKKDLIEAFHKVAIYASDSYEVNFPTPSPLPDIRQHALHELIYMFVTHKRTDIVEA